MVYTDITYCVTAALKTISSKFSFFKPKNHRIVKLLGGLEQKQNQS